nr:MAG TPA: hypothetical protein [Bacteriophage sp.]
MPDGAGVRPSPRPEAVGGVVGVAVGGRCGGRCVSALVSGVRWWLLWMPGRCGEVVGCTVWARHQQRATILYIMSRRKKKNIPQKKLYKNLLV